MRNISRRLLLIIVTTRRRLQYNSIAEDTGLAHQFCDGGLFCCVFDETILETPFTNNDEMSSIMQNLAQNRNWTNLSYADDIEFHSQNET